MDELVNELSCTMIDVDGEGTFVSGVSTTGTADGAEGVEAAASARGRDRDRDRDEDEATTGPGAGDREEGEREVEAEAEGAGAGGRGGADGVPGEDVEGVTSSSATQPQVDPATGPGARKTLGPRAGCSGASTPGTAARPGSGSKQKGYKPVTRSASILLRSKVLILSDSESEDNEDNSWGSNGKQIRDSEQLLEYTNSLSRKQRAKKHKRKKSDKQRGPCLLGLETPGNLCFGKRKRSTTISFSSPSNEPGEAGHEPGSSEPGANKERMEIDANIDSFDSSSLSDSSCNSEHNYDEADDEQSDFYEVMAKASRGGPSAATSSKTYKSAIPIPRNPFASVTASGSSSVSGSSFNSMSGVSAMLWKRRRRNHWP